MRTMLQITQYLHPEVFITLLVMINPLSVLAPYMAITHAYTQKEKQTILRQAIVFSAVILLSFIVLGRALLDLLGISTFALQISGGILFFKFGYETLNGKKTEVEENADLPSLVPIGFPIIAGPGSITAIIVFTSLPSTSGPPALLVLSLVLAIVLALLLTYFLLKNDEKITNLLGKRATSAIVKIMGLFVMAIGVQLVLTGIRLWLYP